MSTSSSKVNPICCESFRGGLYARVAPSTPDGDVDRDPPTPFRDLFIPVATCIPVRHENSERSSNLSQKPGSSMTTESSAAYQNVRATGLLSTVDDAVGRRECLAGGSQSQAKQAPAGADRFLAHGHCFPHPVHPVETYYLHLIGFGWVQNKASSRRTCKVPQVLRACCWSKQPGSHTMSSQVCLQSLG